VQINDDNYKLEWIDYILMSKRKLCMSIDSISRHILFSGFVELTFGFTAQKLSRTSWSISADMDVARVHLRQLIEKFLDEALRLTQPINQAFFISDSKAHKNAHTQEERHAREHTQKTNY